MELAAGLSGDGLNERDKDDDDAAGSGRLTYEIFSLLEAKFLFGAGDIAPRHLPALLTPAAAAIPPAGNSKRDTVRPLLVPCYDMATRSPFVFSRADAGVSAAHDFRLRDVCAATTASGAAVEVVSVDGGGTTRIRTVGGGGAALGNPSAAAITHVLNNRRGFPDAATIDDLLVKSIGTGRLVVDAAVLRRRRSQGSPPRHGGSRGGLNLSEIQFVVLDEAD
ncbi:hypothetical protein HU200_028062 [Digitaria exilis]|uniref:PNPLA domain-containing protein n=1 Tax=Digitaria exilis TaxID=1010633 RepID=A0A835BVQ4_9POAL|nr:hypothetical protein HU200_028062 [Digitaria exilis]